MRKWVPAETTDCFMMTVACQADINKLFVMRTQIFSLSLLHRFKIQPSTLQTSEWCEFSLCNAVPTDTRSRHWQNSRGQLLQIPRFIALWLSIHCATDHQNEDMSGARAVPEHVSVKRRNHGVFNTLNNILLTIYTSRFDAKTLYFVHMLWVP